jgi:hypothetical protein
MFLVSIVLSEQARKALDLEQEQVIGLSFQKRLRMVENGWCSLEQLSGWNFYV